MYFFYFLHDDVAYEDEGVPEKYYLVFQKFKQMAESQDDEHPLSAKNIGKLFRNSVIEEYEYQRGYWKEDELLVEFYDMMIKLIKQVFNNNNKAEKETVMEYMSMEMESLNRCRLMMLMMNRIKKDDDEETMQRKEMETCDALTNWEEKRLLQELEKEYTLTTITMPDKSKEFVYIKKP